MPIGGRDGETHALIRRGGGERELNWNDNKKHIKETDLNKTKKLEGQIEQSKA
jgi:hypothetical protein